jgi:hypothetical protein
LKVLSVILSIYFLSLTLIPCVDDHNGSCDHKKELAKKDLDSHSSGIDICSPLCICSCCGASLSIVLNSFFIPEITIPAVLNFQYIDQMNSGILNSFWQPPKF